MIVSSGTQSRMSMKEERINSPDIKLHYTPRQSMGGAPRPQTAAPSSRQNPSRNRNSNNEMDDLSEEGIAKRNSSDAASTASKISVHISTGEEDVVEEGSPRAEAVDPEATPRSQDVTVGSTRGGGESMADVPTPRTQDLIDLTPREEAQDFHADREGNTGQREPNMSSENGTSNGQFEDMLSKVETVQGASDIPGSGMIQEDGEYGPECVVTDEGVVDLHGQMAQVNLNDATDGVVEDDIPEENVEGDVTEQIDDGTDVIAIEKLHSQESGIVPQEEEPGDLNNNTDQVRSVSFAEPDR